MEVTCKDCGERVERKDETVYCDACASAYRSSWRKTQDAFQVLERLQDEQARVTGALDVGAKIVRHANC